MVEESTSYEVRQMLRLLAFISDELPGGKEALRSETGDPVDLAIKLLRERVVEADVPVFVVKGTDQFALGTIQTYSGICNSYGLYAQAHEVQEALKEMRAWQEAHPDRVKLPDHKHVPVGLPLKGRS